MGYHSIRLKPTETAKESISALYKELLEVEQREGIKKSQERLEQVLAQKGVSYEEFISSL